MDDWQKEWWKQVEKTAADMEEFLVDAEQATESFVEEVTESFVEEVTENVSSFLAGFGINLLEEVDRFIDDFVDVIVTTKDEIDAAIAEDWADFADDDFTDVRFHQPSTTNNPACIDCINYHGQSYNGNLLVCAMHPEGWADQNCPDWEQKN